jgi:hypothetical protein
MVAPAAQATLADLEALQSGNANLLFQYRFEGSDDSARLADTSGNGYALQRVAGSVGGDVNNILFVPGFDGVSQAYQPSFDTTSYQTGAGLNTISTTVPIGSSVTVEAVIQLNDFMQPADNTTGAYILSARPQPSNGRAYFLRQLDDTGDRITSTLGNTFGDVPPVLSYTPNDWYYLAFVADYDSMADQTTITWYAANLSDGESSLSLLATDNTTFQGAWNGDAQVGIGNFLNGTQEYMQGRLDSIALTSALLPQSELQNRLDALLIPVPEPSTYALLGFVGGLALLFRRLRRA